MKTLLPAIAALMLLLAAGCTQRRPAATPRPYGFMRTEIYPAYYRRAALPGGWSDSVAVNARAIVEPGEKAGWFNIVYPAYGITVNCTLTDAPGDSLAAALANRMERMERNVGSARARVTEWCGVMLMVSYEALRTPVQFLATDSVSRILSGVAVADFPADVDPDSVRPMISAVADDMDVLLRSL